MKIIRNPVFTAPVKVMEPTDGGQRERQFTARFRALTLSEQGEFDASSASGTNDMLRAIVVGWDGLTEDDGAPFEFSTENLNVLLDLSYIRFAIARAYYDATSGVRAAKRGN